jgi:hypothetical protein
MPIFANFAVLFFSVLVFIPSSLPKEALPNNKQAPSLCKGAMTKRLIVSFIRTIAAPTNKSCAYTVGTGF